MVITLKRPYFSLIIGAVVQNVKTDHEKQRLWMRDCKHLPYMCLCIHPCVCLSDFNINLNISFIYKDIFIKFAGNVCGYKNLSLQKFGLIFSQLFKSHKVVLNLEIFQLASSNLHKRYMARKASLIVILT